MQNVSNRHRRAALKAAAAPVATKMYRILDPHHKPDIRGEFAGAKVQVSGAEHRVMLTEAQAKFYKDQGQIELVG